MSDHPDEREECPLEENYAGKGPAWVSEGAGVRLWIEGARKEASRHQDYADRKEVSVEPTVELVLWCQDAREDCPRTCV
jgi:hypothetical protein